MGTSEVAEAVDSFICTALGDPRENYNLLDYAVPLAVAALDRHLTSVGHRPAARPALDVLARPLVVLAGLVQRLAHGITSLLLGCGCRTESTFAKKASVAASIARSDVRRGDTCRALCGCHRST